MTPYAQHVIDDASALAAILAGRFVLVKVAGNEKPRMNTSARMPPKAPDAAALRRTQSRLASCSFVSIRG
jgi:hypothetical protein